MENRVRLTTRIAAGAKKEKEPKKGDLQRDIPADIEYDTSKIKHIKKILHNINVAVGNLTGASKEFSMIKGPEISPDGLLGGNGYIKSIREVKESISTAVHGLADISDTLVDELNNPKWGIKEKDKKDLEKEKEEIEEKAEEAEENLSGAPEEGVAEEKSADEEAEAPAESGDKKDDATATDPSEESTEKESKEISVGDVRDSSDIEQEKEAADFQRNVDRYLSATDLDKTQKILSKHILAGLLK